MKRFLPLALTLAAATTAQAGTDDTLYEVKALKAHCQSVIGCTVDDGCQLNNAYQTRVNRKAARFFSQSEAKGAVLSMQFTSFLDVKSGFDNMESAPVRPWPLPDIELVEYWNLASFNERKDGIWFGDPLTDMVFVKRELDPNAPAGERVTRTIIKFECEAIR